METLTVALPPELRPRLVGEEDRLFGRLLATTLSAALCASALIATRVVPEEPLPAEPPRIVREFVLPLPIAPPARVEVAPAPAPVAPPALTPRPGLPARPTTPTRAIDELGLVGVLGHGGAIDAVLDDETTPDLTAALDGATRLRATAALGSTIRGEETGRAATIDDLEGRTGPAPVTLREHVASVPLPAPPPPHVDLLPPPGDDPSGTIGELFRRRLPAIRRCYEKGITRDRALKGRLVLRFVVEEGRVEELELQTATLASISTCVRAVVRATPFPRELSSGPIELPIVFAPSSDAG